MDSRNRHSDAAVKRKAIVNPEAEELETTPSSLESKEQDSLCEIDTAEQGTSGKDATAEGADGSEVESDAEELLDINLIRTGQRSRTRRIGIFDLMYECETEMDDETDRVLGASANFNWLENLDTFKGHLEEFRGPNPGPLKEFNSPYEAFIEFWDSDIVNRIVLETNRYAKQTIDALKANGKLEPNSRMQEWTDTNSEEILVLFAVWILMGTFSRGPEYEFWGNGILCMPIMRSMMSFNRYILLNKFMHFIDNSLHNKENVSPRLHKQMPVIKHLNKKFGALYNLGRNVNIEDALMEDTRFLRPDEDDDSRAPKFFTKSFELRESQTGYTARIEAYDELVGSEIDFGVKSMRSMVNIIKDFQGRGHCVSLSSTYCSPSLARYLKSVGFDCIGTVRCERRHMPEDIAEGNIPNRTIISRHCGDICITARPNWDCATISTYHDASSYVIPLRGVYNHMYSSDSERGIRWYIKIFKRLLNVSLYNAFILYSSSLRRRGVDAVPFEKFRIQVAEALFDRHKPGSLGNSECDYELIRLRTDVLHTPAYITRRKRRQRCVVCSRLNVTKLVTTKCSTCKVPLCFGPCWKLWHTLPESEASDLIQHH